MVTGKIIFLGNSITEGGEWTKLTGDNNIINRGIGGDITSTRCSWMISTGSVKNSQQTAFI